MSDNISVNNWKIAQIRNPEIVLKDNGLWFRFMLWTGKNEYITISYATPTMVEMMELFELTKLDQFHNLYVKAYYSSSESTIPSHYGPVLE